MYFRKIEEKKKIEQTNVKRYKREVSCVYLQIYSILDT